MPVEYNCATVFCFAHRFCENVVPLFPILYVITAEILVLLLFNRKYIYWAFLDEEYSLSFPRENKCMYGATFSGEKLMLCWNGCLTTGFTPLSVSDHIEFLIKALKLKFEITSDQTITE